MAFIYLFIYYLYFILFIKKKNVVKSRIQTQHSSRLVSARHAY